MARPTPFINMDEEDRPSVHQKQEKRKEDQACCSKPKSAASLVRDTEPFHRQQDQQRHQKYIETILLQKQYKKTIFNDTTLLLTMKSELEDDIEALQSKTSSLRASLYPLRWNKHTRSPRHTVHPHPLRLVHTSTIYHLYNGRFVCDIHEGEWQHPAYVFHCPLCLFDVCLECVASPCSLCSEQECCHTKITIDLE